MSMIPRSRSLFTPTKALRRQFRQTVADTAWSVDRSVQYFIADRRPRCHILTDGWLIPFLSHGDALTHQFRIMVTPWLPNQTQQ